MRTSLLPLAVGLIILAGFGCTKAPETTLQEYTADSGQTELMETASTTAETATTTPATGTTAATAPKTGNTAPKKNFYIEMDDRGAFPTSGTAVKNSIVTVTFKVRPTNVFYNGLIIKSNRLDLGKVQGGQSKTVTFTATEDITFVGQWPNGASKARWTLIVK